jgi:CHAT domain-containing protein
MSDAAHPTSCPESEDLGAYVEGTLDDRTMSEITAHIATCNGCLDAIAGAIRFRREEHLDEAAAPRRFPNRAIWLTAVAAAALVAVVGLSTLRHQHRSAVSPLESLAAAAPHDYRVVEARLTGFPWAAVRRYRESGGNSMFNADPSYLKMVGAAGIVLEHSRNDNTADLAHAAGVAKLLLHDSTAAVGWLETASDRAPTDAHVWSDLAGARLARAVEEKKPADLPLALEAADRAIALDPRLADARFNRALILEKLGLRAEAADAWHAYLRVDPGSGWAEEARRHVKRLGPSPVPSAFRDRIDSIERAAMANDEATVRKLIDPYRQDARAYFEVDLGVWGKAILDGNRELGARKLSTARTVAASLVSLNGEALLHDAVHEIDSAPGDRIPRLAEAHRRYREGRLAYRDHALPAAEKTLTDAASRFDALGSPMGGVARYYAAKTVFDQNRVLEAQAILERLVAGDGLARANHRALDAQVRADLGRCYGYGGRWRETFVQAERANATFSALGEFGFVATTESFLAEACDLLAQRTEAWRHRVASFELLSAHPYADRLVVAISGGARAEAHDGHPHAALSLLTLELSEARRMSAELSITDALRRRALILAATGDEPAAWRDLREAGALAKRIGPGFGERLQADNRVAEAVLTRPADPRRAIALLEPSIQFFRDANEGFALPDALLERARAERAIHETDAAHRDLEEGIRNLESQRAEAAGPESRATILDAGSGLFEEAVDSFAADGEGERAFAYAERGRGRSLLTNRGGDAQAAVTSTRALSQALPPAGLLVEFMLVRGAVVEFAVSRHGLAVVRSSQSRTEIESHVRLLRAAIEERREVSAVRTEAAWLDAALLAPLRSVAGEKAHSIVVVPDRFLEAVPWALLCDGVRGPWLMEEADLTVAPSAEVWLRDTRRFTTAAQSAPRLLAVSSSGGGTTEALEQSDDEARAIASLYRTGDVLTDREATADRFLRDSSQYDVIHFAGHARSDSAGGALLFAPGAGGNDTLSAHDIAAQHFNRIRLVVLAACGTASGDDERLDGVPTLARAFLEAGAPSVVAALWPIDDEEAAALGREFHRALGQSGNPAAALRVAQRFMLSSANVHWRDPASWAGVELLGASIPP